MSDENERAHRCRGCGLYNGVHAGGCYAARRDAELRLQAECDHSKEGISQTTGIPLGPPCCARCGFELPRLSEREVHVIEQLERRIEKYGADIVMDSGGLLSRNTIYVLLGRMEDNDFIEGRDEPVPEGDTLPRRWYRVTNHGRQVLAAHKRRADSFVSSASSARGRFEEEVARARAGGGHLRVVREVEPASPGSITTRPPNVAFRPERVVVPASPASDWIINDIRVGNIAQMRTPWYVRLWRRLTWFWPRRPPVRRLINRDGT